MSKELEYIDKRIELLEHLIANPTEYTLVSTINVKIDASAVYQEELETLKNIKQSLLELQAIKEAKPSEALKCLEKVKKYEVESHIKEGWNIILYEEMQEELDTIKATLLKAEKLEKEVKAFNVLKEYFDIQIIETDSKEKATIVISRKDNNSMLHFAQKIIKDKEKITLLKEAIE